MQQYTLEVSAAHSGMRLDLFIAESLKEHQLGLSRTHIQRVLRQQGIRVNDSVAASAHHRVKEGDRITVSVEEQLPQQAEAEDIPLEVLYEDADLAVINKQPGLVVHPAPGNARHTLVNALMHRFGELSTVNPQRPGIVHRIDKETSGTLVIAKNNFVHLALAEQFSAHTIKRIYCAVVKGRVEFDEGLIELPIGRHPRKREAMAVGFGEDARYAKTRYRTLERTETVSLVELELFTGRTHQIRVHLAFLGHPVLGDAKYGTGSDFGRLALHAKTIGFTHPRTKKFVEFSSAIPPEILAPFGRRRPK